MHYTCYIHRSRAKGLRHDVVAFTCRGLSPFCSEPHVEPQPLASPVTNTMARRLSNNAQPASPSNNPIWCTAAQTAGKTESSGNTATPATSAIVTNLDLGKLKRDDSIRPGISNEVPHMAWRGAERAVDGVEHQRSQGLDA